MNDPSDRYFLLELSHKLAQNLYYRQDCQTLMNRH